MAQLMIAGDAVVSELLIARGIWSRMRGLLGRKGLPEGSGMLLEPCGSIHTIGMRFALDVVFLDREQRVVRVVKDLKPNRMAWGGFGAHSAVELESGWCDLSRFPVGIRLEVV